MILICPRIVYQPILTTPAETTYPFVVNVVITDKNGQPTTKVGAETATFTVTYNRDMDTTVQPQVSFGPDTPMTDLYHPSSEWRLAECPHLGGDLQYHPHHRRRLPAHPGGRRPGGQMTPGWSAAMTPGASASRSSPRAPRP